MNDQVQPEGQTKMLLYDIESDKVIPVDFGSTHHVTPVTQHWDTTDGRVFVTEVEGFISRPSADPDMTEICTPFKEVFTMFATSDNGIHIQDRKLINDASDSLIGSSMPFHFYLKKVVSKDSKQGEELIIEKKATKDFEGMEDADQNTIKATLDFSFYLSLGNMDEAFKCIHSIKNKAVWEHLAKMCVKTKRLDVAMMCLSNIGSSHTIRALREAAKEPEPEVQIGILAAYLGLLPDAENILSSCNRYDILNKLYQASGQWEKSLELSGTKDRINLRTAYHKFGKYLGEIGDVNGALAAFEKSAAYSFENLKKWWAQFTESQGDYPTALKYYELAEDILSTVRVYCYCGKMQQAIELAQKTKNSAAAYHIARQYENDKKINEAIAFYSSAKCFNHAIRLAKEYKMENELIHLALQGSKESMLEVARYYETTPKNHDKAIHLFFKAGSVARAIDLCFQTNQFGILGDLCSELGKDIDPKLLRKCAAFFYEHGQFDKSVSLLVKAGDNAEALDICIQKNVTITEELANDMSVTSDTQELVAKGILIRIADCCLQQRSFLVASKKYTQAGERMKAMKALLQSGDTEKIIFFANALGSKQKEIFVMVANYLQTLDWRNDQTVMKAIISFYTKAKALDSLATFYEACAQVEIDEYQDYEKGLSALTEAAKCLSKAKNVSEAEIRLRTLQHKMDLIKQFVEARNIVKLDPSSPKWVAICEKLLAEPDIDESGVKSGDIYAMMIETHYSATFYEPAFNLLQRMKEKVSSANIEYFLDNRIVQALDKNERKLMEVNDDIREDIREEY
ncbi:hypothetical protein HDU92_008241 [Lobulomyces angularis]|nr:hypothetical protein HDU92_008241 [Lobulomyces angularis]